MKLEAIKRFNDRETKEQFAPGDIFERSEARGKQIIKAGVAKEVGAEKTLDELEAVVSNIDSPKEIDKLKEAEKEGQDRKGAYEILESKKEELKPKKKGRKKKSE